MTTFVQIVVNVPAVSGIFDYSLPASLLGKVGAGHLVIAPFGKQTVQGVVFRFIDQPSVAEVKEILELVDAAPVMTQTQIALADAMSESTLSSLASIVSLFLPAGLSQEADTLYSVREQNLENHRSDVEASSIASRIVRLIQERGPLRGRQLDSHFSKVDWRKVAVSLVRKGVLESKSVLPPRRVRSKYIKTAQLAVAPEILEAQIDHLGKTESTQNRRSWIHASQAHGSCQAQWNGSDFFKRRQHENERCR